MLLTNNARPARRLYAAAFNLDSFIIVDNNSNDDDDDSGDDADGDGDDDAD